MRQQEPREACGLSEMHDKSANGAKRSCTATIPPPADTLKIGTATERHGTIEELVSGYAVETFHGSLYVIRTPVGELDAWASQAVHTWEKCAKTGVLQRFFTSGGNYCTRDVVFMDTETTGLEGVPLFMVGMLLYERGEPVVVQYLARSLEEEAAVLAAACRRMEQARLFVTYNGEQFDVPFILERMGRHSLKRPKLPTHLDLLPWARAILGRSLGNCRLVTLETHLCRRERLNDIAGEMIPQAYHDYLDSGDAKDLARIVAHNRFDILALAELTGRLACCRESADAGEPGDAIPEKRVSVPAERKIKHDLR